MPRLYQTPPTEPIPALAPDYAAEKLASGVPLLQGESVALDEEAFRWRWQAVTDSVQHYQGGVAARALAVAMRQGRLPPGELLADVLAGRPEALDARSNALGLDGALVAVVVRLTMFPVLARFETGLAPLRAGVPWERGQCPTCGNWPLLGEFRGLEQTRFLRCGWCAAEWEVPRLRCPFCRSRDHESLNFLHVEGEGERCGVAFCSACGGRVKMLATLAALTGPGLLAADAATLHLDLAFPKGP